MSKVEESKVFSLLQPDLLTVDELLEYINSRCNRIRNLNSMTKEGLVRIFRQIILPHPQRLYRSNRRGKMLTSRRDSRKKDEGSGFPNERLKPPPDISSLQTIRSNSQLEKSRELDNIVINDRRKCGVGEPETKTDRQSGSLNPGGGFFLKRPYGYEKSQPPSREQNKKPRTAIRWP